MYKLDGQPIDIRNGATIDGTFYPAGTLAVARVREELGIVWEAPPVLPDRRFYMSSTAPDGTVTSTPLPLENAPTVDENGDPVIDPETGQQAITHGVKHRIKQEIKAIAGSKITAQLPEWKQRNMTARSVELVNKQLMGGALTADEQAEADAIADLWAWAKSIRVHSGQLEADLDALTTTEEVQAFDVQAGWPA